MTEPLTDRGLLLRWWRKDLAELSLEAAARAAGVRSQTTVHNWESGRTEGPSGAQLKLLDQRYRASGALLGLYSAIRTPDALEAAAQWWKNFQGPSGPCWAWLRVQSKQSTVARVEAGPFAVDVEVPAGSGVFVQAYAFTNNPPVHVTLAHRGWADFGYGIVPPQIGVPIVDAAADAVIGPRQLPDPALLTATKVWLPGLFGSHDRWFDELKMRLGHRVESTRQTLLAAAKGPFGTGSDLRGSHASREDVQRRWDASRFETLRLARGLSLSDLADASSALDQTLPTISRDHIHRFEHGATPRVPQFVERLDMALGADGQTCTVAVDSTRVGPALIDVNFPSFWIGPVWIQFLAPQSKGTVGIRSERNDLRPVKTGAKARLTWKPWHKSLLVRDGVVVTTRKAAVNQRPLRVEFPPGWNVIAGVGVHPRAVDVNEGWGLVTTEAAFDSLRHYYGILDQALRHTRNAPSVDAPGKEND